MTRIKFVLDNSLLLIAGTVAAVVWANLDLTTYERIAHPLHFWVNDVGMVFFFARRQGGVRSDVARRTARVSVPGRLAAGRGGRRDGGAGRDLWRSRRRVARPA
jgi:hypothetical protein